MSNAEVLLRAIVDAKTREEERSALGAARAFFGPPKINTEKLMRVIVDLTREIEDDDEKRIDMFEVNGFVVSVLIWDAEYHGPSDQPDFSYVKGIVSY